MGPAAEAEPPPGWISFDNLLRPNPSVLGAAAREPRFQGVCREYDCRRQVYVDLQRWAACGYARISLAQLKRMYACSRLDTPCGLTFPLEPQQVTLPLSALAGKANVRLRFTCSGRECSAIRWATAEEAIARLMKLQKGNAATSVAKLADLLTATCTACQGTAWRTEVMWCNTRTNGWRAGLRPWPKDGPSSRAPR